MERKEVIVSEQELARQKEFTRKMREMNDRRTRTPLALVDTFGCQQNVADGEVLMGMLREMGYELTRDENQADVILLNTCAIREHAEKRVYGHLGRLSHTKAAKPDQIICLCGCVLMCSDSSAIGMRVTPNNPSEAAASSMFSMQHQIDAKSLRELNELGWSNGSRILKKGSIRQPAL